MTIAVDMGRKATKTNKQNMFALASQSRNTGLFPAILGKGPCPRLGKNDQLNSKVGKFDDIEHNKDSKIPEQNI